MGSNGREGAKYLAQRLGGRNIERHVISEQHPRNDDAIWRYRVGIALDTKIIPELFKPTPDPAVKAWVGSFPRDELFATPITCGELLFSLYFMPEGRRRSDLLQGLTRLFEQKLARYVLAYDDAAVVAQAAIAAARRGQGRLVGHADMMNACIASSRAAKLATRDVRDFEGCDVSLINPWH